MDEPTSALDPVATLRIEELIQELKVNYTIIIVTHNMQQAARASDHTVFINMDEDRAGYVVEAGTTGTPVHQARQGRHRGLHHRPVRMTEVRSQFHAELNQLEVLLLDMAEDGRRSDRRRGGCPPDG